ncbi:unnamed protein product, partial [Prorocentrum cordatum]
GEFSLQGAEVDNAMFRGSVGQAGAHCDARGPEVEGHREVGASADLPTMPAVHRFPSLGAGAQAGARGAFEGGEYVDVGQNGEHDGAQDVGQCDEDEFSADAAVAPDPESDGDRRWEVAVAKYIRAQDFWMAALETTLRSAGDDSMMNAEMECSEVEAAFREAAKQMGLLRSCGEWSEA